VPLPQVYQFSTKQTEMALRVASLDYLGTVATHLRKDAVHNAVDKEAVDRILKEVTLITNRRPMIRPMISHSKRFQKPKGFWETEFSNGARNGSLLLC